MKQYLLLRENQESGPYSVEDLKRIGLISYDLIWVEGKSTRWMYPSEVSELSDVPVGHARKVTFRTSFDPQAIKQEEAVYQDEAVYNEPVVTSQPERLACSDIQALPGESYIWEVQDKKFSFQNSFSKTRGLWIIGLLIALFTSAVVVKSIVESFEENPYKKSEASVYAMPVTDDFIPITQPDPAYKNALATEVVAVDTTARKTLKKKPVVKDLKKHVSLEANEFKQGVPGGISDLRLTLKNSSEEKLDRVTVEVKFLKPDGEVVKTEHFDLNSIPAGGRKVLQVPDSKRGVKVKYKVVAVESMQQKTFLRNA